MLLSKKVMLNQLLTIRTKNQLDYFKSFGADDIEELYKYFFGKCSICECSYELQCAVFDANEELYYSYVDAYFINKLKELRVDKYFVTLPHKVIQFFFGELL